MNVILDSKLYGQKVKEIYSVKITNDIPVIFFQQKGKNHRLFEWYSL